jgi:hypothetical protein
MSEQKLTHLWMESFFQGSWKNLVILVDKYAKKLFDKISAHVGNVTMKSKG